MAEVSAAKIDELELLSGYFERVSMRRVAAGMEVTGFGVSIVEMGPDADEYPEHDHDPEGIGGEMFAKRPDQLGQEELYIALSGAGHLEADGERLPIDPDHMVRLGPTVTRKVYAGPEGLRLLCIGGTPGRAYGEGPAS